MKTSKPKKQKLGPNQRKWIKALRSGKYKQTNGVLHDRETGGMCCLGVACSVFGMRAKPLTTFNKEKVWEYGNEYSLAPAKITRMLGLRTGKGHWTKQGLKLKRQFSLADANDCGATFQQIADFCEAYPEAVFTKPC